MVNYQTRYINYLFDVQGLKFYFKKRLRTTPDNLLRQYVPFLKFENSILESLTRQNMNTLQANASKSAGIPIGEAFIIDKVNLFERLVRQ